MADFAAWMESHFQFPYSIKSQRVYLSIVSSLRAYIQTKDIRSLDEFNAAWVRRFVADKPDGSGVYSPAYRSLRLSAVNLFWNWLMHAGLARSNPAAEVLDERKQQQVGPRPRGGMQPKRLPPVLQWHDQSLLRQAVLKSTGRASVRDYAIICLALASGLRSDELQRLRLPDLEVEHRTLRVIGKGNKERLVRFDHDDLVSDALEAWLAERSLLLPELDVVTDRVFVSLNGRPLTESGIYQQISRYMSLAGLTDRVCRKGPHVLRHTATSIMFARRVPVLQIQDNLGHEDLTTTQIYAHLLSPERPVLS